MSKDSDLDVDADVVVDAEAGVKKSRGGLRCRYRGWSMRHLRTLLSKVVGECLEMRIEETLCPLVSVMLAPDRKLTTGSSKCLLSCDSWCLFTLDTQIPTRFSRKLVRTREEAAGLPVAAPDM